MNAGTRPDFCELETIIGLAAAIFDLTDSFSLCHEIPSFLSKSLGVEAISLSLFERRPEDDSGKLFFCGVSEIIAPAAISTIHACADEIYAKSKMCFKEQLSSPSPPFRHTGLKHAISLARDEFGGALLFGGVIDAQNHLCLVVHQRSCGPELSTISCDNMAILAYEMTQYLRVLVACRHLPHLLTPPFNRLNAREWTIMQALNTELCEKQLAALFNNINPHTLHSYIRTIYRKIGVQGRLELIQQFRNVWRDMRIGMLSPKQRDLPAKHGLEISRLIRRTPSSTTCPEPLKCPRTAR